MSRRHAADPSPADPGACRAPRPLGGRPVPGVSRPRTRVFLNFPCVRLPAASLRPPWDSVQDVGAGRPLEALSEWPSCMQGARSHSTSGTLRRLLTWREFVGSDQPEQRCRSGGACQADCEVLRWGGVTRGGSAAIILPPFKLESVQGSQRHCWLPAARSLWFLFIGKHVDC